MPWFRTVQLGSCTNPPGATVVGVTVNVAGAETTRSAATASGRVMVLLVPKLTAPFRAKALPSMVALSTRVIDVNARILPLNVVPVPSVAELPTCHHTFFAWAPPLSSRATSM